MQLFHDSRNPAYRHPGGAQPCGTQVTLRLRVEGGRPDAVHLRQWFDKESFTPMQPSADDPALYEAQIHLPETPCLLWYDFQVWQHGQFQWYGNAEDMLDGVGALTWGEARSYQITVYAPAYETPPWTDGAVFYQIFPDRFAQGKDGPRLPMEAGRSLHEDWDEKPDLYLDYKTHDNYAHDFFGGTLRGIAEKLPYLADLGVTGLYLNPIFHAGTNHRFDTIDWLAIDPQLGTEADFVALCETAAEHGIHIVLDGVFNHSGHTSPFFQDAQQNPGSPYRNWYHFEHWPDMYKSWWGFQTLPDLNKRQPEVIDYFLTGEDPVIRHWLRDGAGGWRIDVADELPMAFLRLMRAAVKDEKPDALLIGEVWEDASHKVTYDKLRSYCLGDTLDSVMNYPLREAAISFLLGDIDAFAFKRQMDSLYENYPAPFAHALLNVLGSHDRARALNVLAEETGIDMPRADQAGHTLTPKQRLLGVKRLMLLLELVVAMPGMPCVYYGDEAGMEGCADPFNRGTFPWGHEDKALTAYFKKTLARRRMVGALTDGTLIIDALGPEVIAVRRDTKSQTAVTLINRSNRARKVEIWGRTVSVEAYGCETWEA